MSMWAPWMPFRCEYGNQTTREQADIDTRNMMRMLGFLGDVFKRVPRLVWNS